jgi:hypothetical protein
MLGRRAVLALFGALPLAGCDDDEPLTGSQAYSESTRRTVVEALLDVFLPSGGEGNPGAAEVRAYETLRSNTFVRVLIDLGFLPELPPAWMDRLDDIDGLVKDVLVRDLEAATFLHHGHRHFEHLSLAERTAIVDAQSQGPLRRLYEYARAATMIAFLSAPWTDKGLVAIGFAPYQNFADDLHNSGATDFGYDRIPSVNGREPWTISVNGDLP